MISADREILIAVADNIAIAPHQSGVAGVDLYVVDGSIPNARGAFAIDDRMPAIEALSIPVSDVNVTVDVYIHIRVPNDRAVVPTTSISAAPVAKPVVIIVKNVFNDGERAPNEQTRDQPVIPT